MARCSELVLAGILGVACVHCSTNNPPGAGSPTVAKSGGGWDQRVRVGLVSPPSGSTNVDVAPVIVFGVQNGTDERASDAGKRLAARASFVDAQGASTSAQVQVDPAKGGEFTHYIRLSPVTPLSPDRWYALDIAPPPGGADDPQGIVVGDATGTASTNSRTGAERAFLFTGSAPHIIRVERTSVAGKADDYVNVLLSEPAQLATLVGHGFSVEASGASLQGCIDRNGCVTQPDSAIVNGFDYKLEAPLSNGGAVPALTAFLAGDVAPPGAGRTVAAGASVLGVSLTNSGGVQGIASRIAPADWTACPGSNGEMMCWAPAPPF